MLAEFAALCAEVLRACVHPVDLRVRRIRHQRHITRVAGFGEIGPLLHGLLEGVLAGICEVQLPALLVVRHRVLRAPRAKVRPRTLLLRVIGTAYL